MPVSGYTLGDFSFLDLRGAADLPRQQIEPIQRPGVSGTSFWLTGVRSQPSDWFSLVDCNDLAAAHDQYKQYLAAIDGAPRKLVRAGLDLEAAHSVKFQILNVQIEPGYPRQIASCSPGISSNRGAVLACRWTLQAVAVT